MTLPSSCRRYPPARRFSTFRGKEEEKEKEEEEEEEESIDAIARRGGRFDFFRVAERMFEDSAKKKTTIDGDDAIIIIIIIIKKITRNGGNTTRGTSRARWYLSDSAWPWYRT